jgi:hypothetical protein
VWAVACGNSATGSSSEAAPRPTHGFLARHVAPSSASAPLQADDLLDEHGPRVTEHAVVEVDDVTYPPGDPSASYLSAQMGGSGIFYFLGKRLSAAGGCTLYAAGFEEGGSAGDITVTTKKQTIVADPHGTSPDVDYGDTAVPTYPLASGSVSYSAAGGAQVGTFSGSVESPKAVTGFTAPTTLNRKKALDLTWTSASSSDKIAIVIFVSDEVDGSVSSEDMLVCDTTDTGSYTVAAAALALIPASFNNAEIAIDRYAEKKVKDSTGAYDVTLRINKVSEGGDTTID